jgi:hypothetical protein
MNSTFHSFFFERVLGAIKSVGNDGVGPEPGVLQAARYDICDTICLMVDKMHVVTNNHSGHLAQVVFDPISAFGDGE